jgi:hypothetical protein
MSHDGKPVSQRDLEEQGKKIEKQMREDESKAQKHEAIHPQNRMLFADVIARSNFTPLRWEDINGLRCSSYSGHTATSPPSGTSDIPSSTECSSTIGPACS